MKPFHGLKISFLGFSDEESEHMNEITLQNGNTFFYTASFVAAISLFTQIQIK